MGTRNSSSSTLRVTTVPRARRDAAKKAERSIQAISVPPNSVPMWLVSPGKTTSSDVASDMAAA